MQRLVELCNTNSSSMREVSVLLTYPKVAFQTWTFAGAF